MFKEILKQERLNNILTKFDRTERTGSIKSEAENEVDSILSEIYTKNNEFAEEIVQDKTRLKLSKITKLRERAQEGHLQMISFSSWLIEELHVKIDIIHFRDSLAAVITLFEGYVLRLKERETAIISVRASLTSLLVAIVAILISISLPFILG